LPVHMDGRSLGQGEAEICEGHKPEPAKAPAIEGGEERGRHEVKDASRGASVFEWRGGSKREEGRQRRR
jgi:hypothetical protein